MGLPAGLATVGTDTTLEVATWNIYFFPRSGTATINRVAEILQTLKIDVMGVEEIADSSDFRVLVNLMPDYGGVLSPDVYSSGEYQKTGIIWRKSAVTLLSYGVPAAFDSNTYNFPDNYIAADSDTRRDQASAQFVWAGRPPIEGTLSVNSPRRSYTFHLIVMHLKAGKNEPDSQIRRRCATYVIHRYLNEQISREPAIKYVMVGDWNDELTDQPMALNSFLSFLDDASDYTFLSRPLVGNSSFTSHPIGLIDHIAVNRNACADFSSGRVTTLRLDQIITNYEDLVSDHRPVVAIAPGF